MEEELAALLKKQADQPNLWLGLSVHCSFWLSCVVFGSQARVEVYKGSIYSIHTVLGEEGITQLLEFK